MENNQTVEYALEDKPELLKTFLLGFQHMLAMFVGIITPPLIISGIVGLNAAETGFFISMSLIVSGITSYVQAKKVGPVGSGLLAVQGTSFTFVPMAIAAGQTGGMALIFGMALIASPVEIIISRFIKQAKKLFPPIVTGTVVILIGLYLVDVGLTDFAGGNGAENFGSIQNLLLGSFVLLTIIIANRFGKGLIRVGAIAIGLVAGYIAAIPLGLIDFSAVADASWVTIPMPLEYGLSFELSHLLPWVLAYFITTIESVGDLTAVAKASGESVKGQKHIDRLSGGILADGLGSAFGAIFNTMPNTTFSQNIGVIQITKVGSKVVGVATAIILVVLGLLPKIGALVSVMPAPVLGGATIAMFGMIAASGIKIVASNGLNDRNLFILAISLAFGVGVNMVPEVTEQLPELLATLLSDGVTLGALIAISLNLLLPKNIESTAPAAETA